MFFLFNEKIIHFIYGYMVLDVFIFSCNYLFTPKYQIIFSLCLIFMIKNMDCQKLANMS